jgi:hypothetical protein
MLVFNSINVQVPDITTEGVQDNQAKTHQITVDDIFDHRPSSCVLGRNFQQPDRFPEAKYGHPSTVFR